MSFNLQRSKHADSVFSCFYFMVIDAWLLKSTQHSRQQMHLAEGRIVDDFWLIELRFSPRPCGRSGQQQPGVTRANAKAGAKPAALTKNAILGILLLSG